MTSETIANLTKSANNQMNYKTQLLRTKILNHPLQQPVAKDDNNLFGLTKLELLLAQTDKIDKLGKREVDKIKFKSQKQAQDMINHFSYINGNFSGKLFIDQAGQKKKPLLEDTVYNFQDGLIACEARWLNIPVIESLPFRAEDFDGIEAPLIMHIVEDFQQKARNVVSDLKVYVTTKKGVKPNDKENE